MCIKVESWRIQTSKIQIYRKHEPEGLVRGYNMYCFHEVLQKY